MLGVAGSLQEPLDLFVGDFPDATFAKRFDVLVGEAPSIQHPSADPVDGSGERVRRADREAGQRFDRLGYAAWDDIKLKHDSPPDQPVRETWLGKEKRAHCVIATHSTVGEIVGLANWLHSNRSECG